MPNELKPNNQAHCDHQVHSNQTSSKSHTGVIAWFANNSVAANLLLVGVIIIGVLSLNTLRKEAFPSLEPDVVTVSVTYDSGDPVQAEEGLAIKIEDALETERVFTMLMGDEVPPRRAFIEANAKYANVDV